MEDLSTTRIATANDPAAAIGEALSPDSRAEALSAAWDEGFKSGYRDGLAAAREEQEGATFKLIQLAQQAFLDAHEFTRNLEREVVDFSLAIAEKVTETSVRVDRAGVTEVVRAALTELQHDTVVRVRVNPADIQLVTDQWEGLLPRTSLQGAELVADHEVQPGGCVIETVSGLADGQLSTKLTQIAAMFEAVAVGEQA
jgi:flagellar biosynthesis/type III secretory pathway protein FliH